MADDPGPPQVTTLQSLSDPELIERLSLRPRDRDYRDQPMPSASPSKLDRVPSEGSLGDLDILPLELIHKIVKDLDVRSIANLAQSSLYAKLVAESCLDYRFLLTHAGDTLVALGSTDTARLHTPETLVSAIKTSVCTSCPTPASFLHLVTGKRCCYDCLLRHPALKLSTRAMAKDAFGLSKSQLDDLPDIKVPQERVSYFQGALFGNTHWRFITVGDAKSLAIHKFGSAIDMMEARRGEVTRRFKVARANKCIAMLEANMEPLSTHPSHAFPNVLYEDFVNARLALTSLPHMDGEGFVEYTLWCRACAPHRSDQVFSYGKLFATCYGKHRQHHSFLAQQLAMTRKEFLDHVKQCKHAQKLWLANPARGAATYSDDERSLKALARRS